jgi:hypothetical protein
MEAKIDKILDNQSKMNTSLAVIEEKIKSKDRRLSKVEGEIDGLKKFKWGVIGTAAVSISTFVKSMFG